MNVEKKEGIALENLFSNVDLKDLNFSLEVINTLVRAIEAKDPYTAGHVWRVSQYTKMIAKRLGWDVKKITWIETGAILHDLGKIGITDLILQKDGKLTIEEFSEIKKHPIIGVEIIEKSPFLSQYKTCIEYHHERYDGNGYPYNLKGDEIPIEGRIIAIADTFDALTSNRPYRWGMHSEEAIKIIHEESGTQFDPDIVEVFIKLWWENHFKEIIFHSAPDISLVSCPEHREIIEISSQTKSGDVVSCPVCKMNFILEKIGEKWAPVMK